jgi:hypothetical protein
MGILTQELGRKMAISKAERRGRLVLVSTGYIEYHPAHPQLGVPFTLGYRYPNDTLGRIDNFIQARNLIRDYLKSNQDYKILPKAIRKIICFSPDRLVVHITFPALNVEFELDIQLINGELVIYPAGEYVREMSAEDFLPYLFYVSNALKAFIESGSYREL